MTLNSALKFFLDFYVAGSISTVGYALFYALLSKKDSWKEFIWSSS